MPDDDQRETDDGAAPSDGPVEGSAGATIAADDPRKAEKLTAPSVDGDLEGSEE